MIAKRIESKAANPRMARLVKYVVAAQGQLDPRSWSRTADYMLNSGTSSRGEKVGGVRVTNCETDDPAAATALIEVTQAANTRSRKDKTYHLVFSFPPGEEPDIKILHAIEDELCRAIGYADHQRISAVHIDCDHLHVHVAINKVHPKGFQNIEPYYDKKKLMETCERLELEYGLTRTNHGLTGETPKAKIKSRQAQAEAHSGIESLTGHITRDVAPAIHKAANWQELHATLASHGLEIKKRGAGLVIGKGELWVRASQCDRSFSLKGLTDRLGEFLPPATQSVHPASTAYTPQPRNTHPASSVLYSRYQTECSHSKAVRERGIAQFKYEGELLEYELKKWRRAQRLLVKAGIKGPVRRAMLNTIKMSATLKRNTNRKSIDLKMQSLFASTATPSWSQWLALQTEQGNTDALDVLRSREERETMRGNYLTAKNLKNGFVIPDLMPKADKDGALTYKCADGGIVIDRKTHVQSFRTTSGAAQLALELAAKRFAGQVLIVEGQDEFKKEVIRLAKAYNINVRFAEPELAIKPKTKKKSIHKEAEL